MENAIIIGALLVLFHLALRSLVKHFKRQSGCCGGGGSVPKQKKIIRNAHYRKVMKLEGLHCENCKNNVEKAINSIEGAAAKVNLKEQTAEVVLEREISDEQLKERVENAGFRVIEIVSVS